MKPFEPLTVGLPTFKGAHGNGLSIPTLVEPSDNVLKFTLVFHPEAFRD